MAQAGPRGWTPGLVEHRKQRFVVDSTAPPSSYDETARTVDAILSAGSPVTRFYGREVLAISEAAVDLGRVHGGIPVLDSHDQSSITKSLGKISSCWFSDQGGERALAGRISFNATPEGRKAEAMIARREIGGISIGYRVDSWEIADADGRVIDPGNVRWDDTDLTFTATRWELLECSLVAVPADAMASVRSLNGHDFDVDALVRMQVRTRMRMRMRRAGMMVHDDE
jgi:phage head maturation protease